MRILLSSAFLLLLSFSHSAQQASSGKARAEVPGVKGVLEIDVGPTPWHLDFLPEDKWTMLQALQHPDHVSISALLRQVTFAATAESCRNEFWPKMKEVIADRLTNVQQNMQGGFARVEYTFNGTKNTVSHHLLAYLGSRDLCSEVHLSKTGFVAADQNAFEQVVSELPHSGRESHVVPECNLLTPNNRVRTRPIC